MQTYRDLGALRACIGGWKQEGRRIGFVPTMGNLHAGHYALVELARQHCDAVIASIFVNPTQFGPNEDFAKYPRTLADDCAGSATAGADLVFAPATGDFYAPGASTWVEETFVTEGLCGEFRPGHFRGVTTVVAMLFNAVQPDVAVFGRKDLQQLAALRRMVRDLLFPLRIVAHETVREANGVAMSSRNRYLSPADFAKATAIPAALAVAQALVAAGERDAGRVRSAALARLAAEPAFRPQYCEVVDAETLRPVDQVTPGRTVLAVAGHLGATRLIDNADLG